MRQHKGINPVESNQAGLVSIMMTMVLMIVVSLIVLGFAQVARREQRQTLDNQLSTQAFYAVESGINDAIQVINEKLKAHAEVPEKTVCEMPDPAGNYVQDNVLNPEQGVEYSCLLVKTHLNALNYTLGRGPIVIPINSDSGSVDSLTISWKQPGTTVADTTKPNTPCPAPGAIGNFKSQGGWGACPYPVIRMDLVPVDGGFSRGSLLANNMTAFLVPTNGISVGNVVSYAAASGNIYGGAANQGAVVGAKCTNGTAMSPTPPDKYECAVKVSGLSQSKYVMRISGLYVENSPVSILPTTDKRFIGAQAQIDATGRAQDVLRRAQAHVDISGMNGPMPSAVITSKNSVCKRFYIMPDPGGTLSRTGIDATIGAGESAANPLCVNG
jgi:Tfp pilus assembly protein PilX